MCPYGISLCKESQVQFVAATWLVFRLLATVNTLKTLHSVQRSIVLSLFNLNVDPFEIQP
jgi:hypothetical protein